MPDTAPAILTGATPAQANLPLNAPEGARSNSPFHQATPAPEVQPASAAARRWAELSPNERSRQSQAAVDADAGRFDPAKTIQTRDAAGNLVLKDRATGKVLDASGAPDPDALPPSTVDAGEKIRVGEFEVTEAEVRDMLADKAQRDLARTQIPADPTGYKIELPQDAKLPGDVKFTFATDPESVAMINAAQQWAHKKGLSQSDFSELLSIHAHNVAAQELKIQQIARAEVESLGSNGPQRIDAVSRWIASVMGTEKSRPIIASMVTRAHVEFYEKMFGRFVNGGAGSFSQRGREVESRGVDEATYNSWSYSEKKAYAERMSSQQGRR